MPVCVVLSEASEASALARWAVHFAHGGNTGLIVLDATGQDVESGTPAADAERIVQVSRQNAGELDNHPVLFGAARAIDDVCGGVESNGSDGSNGLDGLDGLDGSDGSDGSDGEAWPQVALWRCRWHCSPRRILRFAGEQDTTLLLSGLQRRDNPLAEPLFKSAPWRAILIRVGGSDGICCGEILVPSAGGIHSRAALRVAHGVCMANHGRLHPLYIEPNLDSPEIASEVGGHMLRRIVDRAGLDEAEHDALMIVPKVVVSDNVTDGIRSVVVEESFDLVLIGVSIVGRIRQKLFGTVPEHLLRDKGSVAVAVIREARPIAERAREYAERWLDLRIPQLTREARVELFHNLQDGSRWSFDFMTLICLSTAIASLGLIQNSTAVVIGAMLVAPLMVPLLGCGLAVVQGNFPLFRSAVRAILYGFVSALGIGFLIGLFAAPMTGLTSEMAARGGPSLLDMGVAFASGVAASYCLARPKLGAALAGVAIAAALVPPIATVGISLSFGETVVARGAALLFATNVVAIVLGAAINFYAAGIRGGSKSSAQGKPLWARRAMLAMVCLCALLAIPLGSAILSAVVEKKNLLLGRQVPRGLRPAVMGILNPEATAATDGMVTVDALRRGFDGDGNAIVEVRISGPTTPDERQLEAIAAAARKFFAMPVVVRLHTEFVHEISAE